MAPYLRKDEKLTAERLRQVLTYDPETGLFDRIETAARTSLVKWEDVGNKTAGGYLTISVDGKHYNAHRLAWLYVHGEFPPSWVYHRNGDRTDNRIANLALKLAKTNKAVSLTLQRLQEVLHYDPATGFFTHKVNTARGRIGERAGVILVLGYRYISVDGRKHLAHRLAWFYTHGKWPEHQIDHINGQRDDNRLANLREADRFQQAHNSPRVVGATGYRGVRKKGRRYLAIITVNNLRIPLGRFDTAEEAHAAYAEASRKYYGDYEHKRK